MDVLGCTDTWVDFDFAGHQLSRQLGTPLKTERTGRVGGHMVPMPHFGLELALPDWQSMAASGCYRLHRAAALPL